MENKFFTIIILVSLLIPISNVCSQDQSNDKETTVEELFLQSIELTVIGEMATDTSRDAKLDALAAIEDMIENGRASANDQDLVSILEYLSMEGNGNQMKEAGLLINNFPEVRRRSCESLGKIGGESAKASLINVLLTEEEPMVLAEAAYALGTIGINKDNQVTQALSYSILGQNIMSPDNNYAFAVLLAFEKIAESNNGIEDPGAIRALVRIQNGNYIKTVQRKAKSVIAKLRTY
jgi:HEAT repeat protein